MKDIAAGALTLKLRLNFNFYNFHKGHDQLSILKVCCFLSFLKSRRDVGAIFDPAQLRSFFRFFRFFMLPPAALTGIRPPVCHIQLDVLHEIRLSWIFSIRRSEDRYRQFCPAAPNQRFGGKNGDLPLVLARAYPVLSWALKGLKQRVKSIYET